MQVGLDLWTLADRPYAIDAFDGIACLSVVAGIDGNDLAKLFAAGVARIQEHDVRDPARQLEGQLKSGQFASDCHQQ